MFERTDLAAKAEPFRRKAAQRIASNLGVEGSEDLNELNSDFLFDPLSCKLIDEKPVEVWCVARTQKGNRGLANTLVVVCQTSNQDRRSPGSHQAHKATQDLDTDTMLVVG